MASPLATQLITELQAAALKVLFGFRAEDLQPAYKLRLAIPDDHLADSLRNGLVRTLNRFDDDPEPYVADSTITGRWAVASQQELGFEALATTMAAPLGQPILDGTDLDGQAPVWYAVVAQTPNSTTAYMQRVRQPVFVKRGRLQVVFRNNVLTEQAPRDRTLRLDEDFALITRGTDVVIRTESILDALFTDRVKLEESVDPNLDALVTHGLVIKNRDDFADACRSDPRMIRKLARVMTSDYIQTLTIPKIQEVIAQFNLSPTLVQEGELQFDSATRWQLLKLLDDDYTQSPMTERRYESLSKVRIV